MSSKEEVKVEEQVEKISAKAESVKEESVKSEVREVPQVVRDLEAKPEHVQLVEVLYEELRKTVEAVTKDEGISAGNIIVIIDNAMKLVGKMKTLNGLEKKAIVITVVKRLVDEAELKPEDAAVVKIIAERALDPAIDQLFAMAPEVYGKVKRGCFLLCR